MNPRLAKELRALRWPWCIAALAGAGHLVALANPVFAHGEFGSFLTGLAGVAFVVGALVLAALPMGFELQDRTLALLLSQPMERTRLWKEKLVVATSAVLTLAVVHGLASVATGRLSPQEALLYVAGLAAAICSVGFYTLAMRSILMGITCAWGAPLAIAASVHLVTYYVLGLRIELSEHATVALIVSGCAVYSAVLLWLSRRQFLELELKDGQISRAAQIPEALVPRKLAELFSARRTGAVANLIRKEVCLQKPIFLVSGVFVVCWLLALMLMLLHPSWHNELVGVLDGLTGTQFVLMVILAGCVSLGDDKSLGTAAWQLTLPISARRQWFVKLSVSTATAVALAVVLPALLAALTLFEGTVGLLTIRTNDAGRILIFSVVVFLVSFWSASMTINTVRAAIITLLALIAIPTCVFLGAGISEQFMIPWPSHYHSLQSGLVTSLIARFHLRPSFFLDHPGTVVSSITLVIGIVAVIALRQSLQQFRRAHFSSRAAFRCAAILAVAIIAGSFWCRDWMESLERGPWKLPLELGAGVNSYFQKNPKLTVGTNPVPVSLQALDESVQLSRKLKIWLRGTKIYVLHGGHGGMVCSSGTNQFTVPYETYGLGIQLLFPNGRGYFFDSDMHYSTP